MQLFTAREMCSSHGLNLPATQGTSNSGNFLPGLYHFDYTLEALEALKVHQISALRLPINVSTDEECLQSPGHYSFMSVLRKLLSYFATVGTGRSVCTLLTKCEFTISKMLR